MYQSLQFNAANVAAKTQTQSARKTSQKTANEADSFRDMVSQAQEQQQVQDQTGEGQSSQGKQEDSGAASGQQKPVEGKKDIKTVADVAVNPAVLADMAAMQKLLDAMQTEQQPVIPVTQSGSESVALDLTAAQTGPQTVEGADTPQNVQELVQTAARADQSTAGLENPVAKQGNTDRLSQMQEQAVGQNQAPAQKNVEKSSAEKTVKLSPDQLRFQQLKDQTSSKQTPEALKTAEQPAETKTGAEKTVKTEDSPEVMNLAAAETKTAPRSDVVTVKLGDSMPLDGKQVEKGLGDAIALKMSDDQKEFDIQLEPANLGKLHIKIAMEETGIKVLISCESEKTMSLLSDHAKGISNLITQNLNEPREVEVLVKEETHYWQQQAQQQEQDQGQQQQRQNKKNEKQDTDDFLQQLRLGLVS